MIIIHGEVTFDEPVSSDLRVKLGALAKAVRERHTGNIDYRFSVDSEDACRLRLTERWDARPSFEKHGKTPEVDDIVKLVAEHKAQSTIIRQYDVSSETVL